MPALTELYPIARTIQSSSVDALLLRLLKMPPQSRAEAAERARRRKGSLLGFARNARAERPVNPLFSVSIAVHKPAVLPIRA